MGAGFIFSLAIGNAVICGIWTYIGTVFAGSLITVWGGFAGCTSYFVSGGGKNGLIRSLCSNLTGILIASIIIFLANIFIHPISVAICTGIFTWLMCYLSHCDLTKFVSCTFIGGFSTFASSGNWKMCLISLVIGNFVGLGSDYLGKYIYKKFFKNKSGKKDWVIGKFLKDN